MPLQFPEKMQCLWTPAPYKVFYGGRGGAKSWNIARALLIMALTRPIRVLCCREFQNSISESVHKLLSDQIKLIGVDSQFDVQKTTICGPPVPLLGPDGGPLLDDKGQPRTERATFNFEGIRNNALKLKSYEGVDICWVEEAAKVTDDSWDTLEPTIRKTGSEIWISFNPDLDTDPTWRRFVVSPPTGAIVVEMSWRDNPWFNEKMLQQMLDMKQRDFNTYLNIWEGQTRKIVKGAVYENEMMAAMAERRITKVPWDSAVPVDVFFDLGHDDSTAMWFRQRCGFEWHYIDYYSNRQKKMGHYLQVMQRLSQEQGYIYGTVWLPHDARANTLAAEHTIEQQVKKVYTNTRIVRKLDLADGINAARTIFDSCWFDEEKCKEGIYALSSYRYDVVEDAHGMLSRLPVHDFSSHAADAFRYSAVSTRQPRSERAEKGLELSERARILAQRLRPPNPLGWMR